MSRLWIQSPVLTEMLEKVLAYLQHPRVRAHTGLGSLDNNHGVSTDCFFEKSMDCNGNMGVIAN